MTSDFDKIYYEHYGRLYRVAFKMLRDKEVAQDMVQDVFVAFYLALEDGKAIIDIKNWLLRTLINKSIDSLHQRKRFTGTESLNIRPSAETSPEQYADNVAIMMVINNMNTRDKSLIVLYSEGYSYREIAEITGIRFNSVGKILARALEKAKKNIK